eukprot:gb/GECH01013682.1/.p1 GENE.gb/GECH01013682.1/~~gb/GECH01013682.1/.p1  ORF type:complete len:212 (+),score=59.61 gb/GECH01013682.1/:1-636(+)
MIRTSKTFSTQSTFSYRNKFNHELNFNCIRKESSTSKPISKEQKDKIDSMIRVNQAGELGAVRICQGQLAVLGKDESVKEILEQEKEHFSRFNKYVADRKVRPTVFHPIWNVAGVALGAGTAMLGREAAMACHAAVEDVISEHYNDQLRDLNETEVSDEELKKTVKQFRDEELGHYHIGIEQGAEKATGYDTLYGAIQTGCRVAIWLSKRY